MMDVIYLNGERWMVLSGKAHRLLALAPNLELKAMMEERLKYCHLAASGARFDPDSHLGGVRD